VTVHGSLPPGLTCYKRTALFTRETVPAGLLAEHKTKMGVWGLLRVTGGRVRYCIDHPRSSVDVAEGDAAVIEPQVLHHVELLDPDSSFLVEFYRAEHADGPLKI
jgi:tellurite methyltransferase